MASSRSSTKNTDSPFSEKPALPARPDAVLYRWSRGKSVDDIIEEFDLNRADHGLLEEIIPTNALWVLHSISRLSRIIGCSSEFVSRIDEMTTSVSNGTDSRIVNKLMELQIPGVGRNTALFLVERFEPNERARARKCLLDEDVIAIAILQEKWTAMVKSSESHQSLLLLDSPLTMISGL